VFPEHAESVGLPLDCNTNRLKSGRRRFVNTSSPRAPGTPRAPRFMDAADGRDLAKVTGCREPQGRRWKESAASNRLMTTRNVKIAGADAELAPAAFGDDTEMDAEHAERGAECPEKWFCGGSGLSSRPALRPPRRALRREAPTRSKHGRWIATRCSGHTAVDPFVRLKSGHPRKIKMRIAGP
jgi:hypothetical protein